jgi:RNA polymerase sigma factor (sigma-70 family)
MSSLIKGKIMSRESEALQRTLKQALHLLTEQKGAELATAVTPIIFTNLDKGRMQTFLEKQNCTPSDYVRRVANTYEQWHEYVQAVQIEKRTDVWQPLYEQLQKWAYSYLPRIGYPSYARRDERLQQAQTCAAEAAVTLLDAYFPYDVNFDPWACTLLQNVTRKQMNRRIRPRLEAQRQEIELDAWDNWLHNLSDPAGEDDQHLVERRVDLLKAIDQLSSEARQQFLLLYYFEGKTFKEIAALMGKSQNALYKLHSDALDNLRKIWRQDGDKYE